MNLLVHECSRIYHCNSLLACITSEQIARMQKITKQCYLTGLPQKTSWTCHTCPEKTPMASCCRTLTLNCQLFCFGTLMVLYHMTSPVVYLHIHPPDLFLQTSDCPRCLPQKCWCTMFLTPGSSRLDFTASEDQLLLVLVIFYVSIKNTPTTSSQSFPKIIYLAECTF